MKHNLIITGAKVQLVPYKAKFVNKYHGWMKDPYILEMTASEPLSIEEEYEMQEAWENDPDKCTFIVLALETSEKAIKEPIKETSEDDELDRMAGDVNLFLNNCDDKGVAEIEVMIAESSCRNKGLAKEALMLMMAYGQAKLGIWRYFAKIDYIPSRTHTFQHFSVSYHLFYVFYPGPQFYLFPHIVCLKSSFPPPPIKQVLCKDQRS